MNRDERIDAATELIVATAMLNLERALARAAMNERPLNPFGYENELRDFNGPF